MSSLTWANSYSYGNEVSIGYTISNISRLDILIPVEDEVTKFIKRYARYMIDGKKIINFIINNNLNTIPVLHAVLEEAEMRLRRGELKGIEIRVSEDVEDPEDITLEIVVYKEDNKNIDNRLILWDKLCGIAEKVAKEGRIEDVLTKVCIIVKG
ncbi:hypothetical protein HRbin04_00311 [archaeon HR04]|nr:hypothetical protein HRbin04_00311 [archaeon HR04]